MAVFGQRGRSPSDNLKRFHNFSFTFGTMIRLGIKLSARHDHPPIVEGLTKDGPQKRPLRCPPLRLAISAAAAVRTQPERRLECELCVSLQRSAYRNEKLTLRSQSHCSLTDALCRYFLASLRFAFASLPPSPSCYTQFPVPIRAGG